jgi:hypothetical protein
MIACLGFGHLMAWVFVGGIAVAYLYLFAVLMKGERKR